MPGGIRHTCIRTLYWSTTLNKMDYISLKKILFKLCHSNITFFFTFFHKQKAGRQLYAGQDEWVHANCALWSAEVFEEVNGSLQNVHSAITRGKQMVRMRFLYLTLSFWFEHSKSNNQNGFSVLFISWSIFTIPYFYTCKRFWTM